MIKNVGVWAKLALLLATILWGSSFIIVKSTVDVFQPHALLALRFTIGTMLLSIIFFRKLKLINKDYIISGVAIGVCLFLAYSTQTIGITDTTPGKNAFLTAVYCVIVPFLFWITEKQCPDRYNFISAILCIVGIGLVSLKGNFTIGFGDMFTLIGGFFYAAHIIAVVKFGKDKDPVLLTILQFATSMVLSWIIALTCEGFPTSVPPESVAGVIFLGVVATSACLLLQNIGQKYCDPSSAAIILSLESVFGVMFSIIFYENEVIDVKILSGFALIFIAVIISETKLRFLRKK